MKLKHLFLSALMLVVALSFTSCKDDDASADYATEVVGTYTSLSGGDDVTVTRTADNKVDIAGTSLSKTYSITITNSATASGTTVYSTDNTSISFSNSDILGFTLTIATTDDAFAGTRK